jgi:hypothetical protein
LSTVRSQKFKLEKPVKIRSKESTAHPSRAHSEVSSVGVVADGAGAEEEFEAEAEAETEAEAEAEGLVGVVVLVLGVQVSATAASNLYKERRQASPQVSDASPLHGLEHCESATAQPPSPTSSFPQ